MRPVPPERPPSEALEPRRAEMAPAAWDPAQRARHNLVRAWEASPLAKANFCALMRVSAAELDAAIEQVQRDRRAPR